jgi:hypothetical protein
LRQYVWLRAIAGFVPMGKDAPRSSCVCDAEGPPAGIFGLGRMRRSAFE